MAPDFDLVIDLHARRSLVAGGRNALTATASASLEFRIRVLF